jgi:MFS family permease
MFGSQLATRVIYPRLGPRRHVTGGLAGVAVSIGLLSLLGAGTSLWWARLLMFTLGLAMSNVFVPVQAISFATISPAETGRGSTMFNAMRQLGGALGVALLTTAVVIVGPTHIVAGHVAANLAAYRVAFLVAAAIVLLGILPAQTISDTEAARTIPDRPGRRARAAAAVVDEPAVELVA